MWDWLVYTYLQISPNQLCCCTMEYGFLRKLPLVSCFPFEVSVINSMRDCGRKGGREGGSIFHVAILFIYFSCSNFILTFPSRLPSPPPHRISVMTYTMTKVERTEFVIINFVLRNRSAFWQAESRNCRPMNSKNISRWILAISKYGSNRSID